MCLALTSCRQAHQGWVTSLMNGRSGTRLTYLSDMHLLGTAAALDAESAPVKCPGSWWLSRTP